VTLHSPITEKLTSGVLTVSKASDLQKVSAPGVAGLVWLRHPPASFQSWIDALDPPTLPRARMILPATEVREAVAEACHSAGTPDGPERDWLVADIAALAETFAMTFSASWLRLRLDVVETDACRRFHIDRVSARLVCTYRGSGTQYGTSATRTPDVIHTVPTGSPFVMRGTLWPPVPDPQLLHRSPPIEGTGETRLMLALDPVSGPEATP